MDLECDEVGELDGVPICVPKTRDYRTCSVCGSDCELDVSFSSDEHGARIAFVCPERGVQLVGPFQGHR